MILGIRKLRKYFFENVSRDKDLGTQAFREVLQFYDRVDGAGAPIWQDVEIVRSDEDIKNFSKKRVKND